MSSELRNVLVIGLGYGGCGATQALASQLPATHRVVAIQDCEFAFNPIPALRAATVPGWEKKITAELDNILPKGSRHVILKNASILKFSSHSVHLSAPVDGFGIEVPFEYAVLATGASYEFPCRAPTASVTASDVQDELVRLQEELKTATSILVVGGGPAGVEFAAEVKELYPEKKVIILHSRARLFAEGWNHRLGESLERQLLERGVELHYSIRLDVSGLKTGKIASRQFDLGHGKSVTADFFFKAFGSQPNSALFSAFDPAIVDRSGAVKVLPTLQVEGYEHLFAIGDLNNVPENKLAGSAYWQSKKAASNLVQLINGATASALKTWSPTRPHCTITLGTDGGAGQVFGLILGPWLVSFKAKKLGTWQFDRMYHI